MNDLSQERAEVRQRFATMRHFVSLAITQREKMCKDFGFDDDELVEQMKHIVAVFSEEERILLEMLAEEDVVEDALLNWREAKQYVK